MKLSDANWDYLSSFLFTLYILLILDCQTILTQIVIRKCLNSDPILLNEVIMMTFL